MKRRWKVTVGVLILAIICAVFLFTGGNHAEHELEATRRSLRQQGFKVDLSEFDFSCSREVRDRAAILATTTRAAMTNRSRPAPIFNSGGFPLMTPAGSNTTLVMWRYSKLTSRYDRENNDLWPLLWETLNTNRARLDLLSKTAVSGPIRFEPIGSGKPNALLPYLADIKNLEWTFATASMLALHEGKPEDAWPCLLAASCLVTEYSPEPIDISHLVRCACATIAFDTLWNCLQLHNWSETQLADLQRRWELVDFWSALPETAAGARANGAALLELERREPFQSPVMFKQVLQSPRSSVPALRDYWTRSRYRRQGIYEDEKALLLYYRDRELELRTAVKARTWFEMRQLPGATNQPSFTSTNRGSRALMTLNLRRMSLSVQSEGRGLLGRIAETEARRRLIVTALAIERCRNRHGFYPKALSDLAPEFLASTPEDFMDGKPLRYHLEDDGRFVLYSAGLDCTDNGGTTWQRKPREEPYYDGSEGYGFRRPPDLVWPRPASDDEAERFRKEQQKGESDRLANFEERQAEDQWDSSGRRQAQVETILKTRQRTTRAEASLVDALYGDKAGTTNKPSLGELLTLKQIVTGAEPETVTFELPIKYDALTNLGGLQLYIDPCKDEDSDEGCNVEAMQVSRGTNGNCLLVWTTIYECDGKHALQAGLVIDNRLPSQPNASEFATRTREFTGPFYQFTVTNLCQFSSSSAHFQPAYGANLRARLAEPNGDYRLEIKAPGGQLLRTFTGSTTNGLVTVHWDLTDERGNRCTNEAFDTVFHVTLPNSGRSQVLKGP